MTEVENYFKKSVEIVAITMLKSVLNQFYVKLQNQEFFYKMFRLQIKFLK